VFRILGNQLILVINFLGYFNNILILDARTNPQMTVKMAMLVGYNYCRSDLLRAKMTVLHQYSKALPAYTYHGNYVLYGIYRYQI